LREGLPSDYERTTANQDEHTQVAQLSQRDRAAGWVSFGQK